MFVPAQPQDAFDPRQPFNRAEARAAGLTPEMLFSMRFHKIFWDTYVAREVPITPLLRAKAVIRLVPSGSYISHHTAAELWGAAPPADGVTHVTLPSASGRQVRQGVRSHCPARANHASQGLADLDSRADVVGPCWDRPSALWIWWS
jgi:hypothetical protein